MSDHDVRVLEVTVNDAQVGVVGMVGIEVFSRSFDTDQVGRAMSAFSGQLHDPSAVLAALVLLGSMIILCWPAKRPTAIAAGRAGGREV